MNSKLKKVAFFLKKGDLIQAEALLNKLSNSALDIPDAELRMLRIQLNEQQDPKKQELRKISREREIDHQLDQALIILNEKSLLHIHNFNKVKLALKQATSESHKSTLSVALVNSFTIYSKKEKDKSLFDRLIEIYTLIFDNLANKSSFDSEDINKITEWASAYVDFLYLHGYPRSQLPDERYDEDFEVLFNVLSPILARVYLDSALRGYLSKIFDTANSSIEVALRKWEMTLADSLFDKFSENWIQFVRVENEYSWNGKIADIERGLRYKKNLHDDYNELMEELALISQQYLGGWLAADKLWHTLSRVDKFIKHSKDDVPDDKKQILIKQKGIKCNLLDSFIRQKADCVRNFEQLQEFINELERKGFYTYYISKIDIMWFNSFTKDYREELEREIHSASLNELEDVLNDLLDKLEEDQDEELPNDLSETFKHYFDKLDSQLNQLYDILFEQKDGGRLENSLENTLEFCPIALQSLIDENCTTWEQLDQVRSLLSDSINNNFNVIKHIDSKLNTIIENNQSKPLIAENAKVALEISKIINYLNDSNRALESRNFNNIHKLKNREYEKSIENYLNVDLAEQLFNKYYGFSYLAGEQQISVLEEIKEIHLSCDTVKSKAVETHDELLSQYISLQESRAKISEDTYDRFLPDGYYIFIKEVTDSLHSSVLNYLNDLINNQSKDLIKLKKVIDQTLELVEKSGFAKQKEQLKQYLGKLNNLYYTYFLLKLECDKDWKKLYEVLEQSNWDESKNNDYKIRIDLIKKLDNVNTENFLLLIYNSLTDKRKRNILQQKKTNCMSEPYSNTIDLFSYLYEKSVSRFIEIRERTHQENIIALFNDLYKRWHIELKYNVSERVKSYYSWFKLESSIYETSNTNVSEFFTALDAAVFSKDKLFNNELEPLIRNAYSFVLKKDSRIIVAVWMYYILFRNGHIIFEESGNPLERYNKMTSEKVEKLARQVNNANSMSDITAAQNSLTLIEQECSSLRVALYKYTPNESIDIITPSIKEVNVLRNIEKELRRLAGATIDNKRTQKKIKELESRLDQLSGNGQLIISFQKTSQAYNQLLGCLSYRDNILKSFENYNKSMTFDCHDYLIDAIKNIEKLLVITEDVADIIEKSVKEKAKIVESFFVVIKKALETKAGVKKDHLDEVTNLHSLLALVKKLSERKGMMLEISKNIECILQNIHVPQREYIKNIDEYSSFFSSLPREEPISEYEINLYLKTLSSSSAKRLIMSRNSLSRNKAEKDGFPQWLLGNDLPVWLKPHIFD